MAIKAPALPLGVVKNNVEMLIAVFEGYDAGEFCQGMVFGKAGTEMLAEIAKTAFSLSMQQKMKSRQQHPE